MVVWRALGREDGVARGKGGSDLGGGSAAAGKWLARHGGRRAARAAGVGGHGVA